MSETNLGFRELRAGSHSLHLLGSIMVDDSIVRFTNEQPYSQSSERYVFANGFTGTKESMSIPKCVAASAGYDARALGSNHNHIDHAISRYAGEIAAVANTEQDGATSMNERVHLVGVSMGGAAVLRAALLCPKVTTVTAEVPACISKTNQLLDLIQGAPERAAEIKKLVIEQPGFALRTAFYSMVGTIRRPLGFLGEMLELATEKVTEDINMLQNSPNPPHIRIILGNVDGLVRKRGVIEAANKLGVEVIISDSGHVNGVLTDRAYTQNVINMNRAA